MTAPQDVPALLREVDDMCAAWAGSQNLSPICLLRALAALVEAQQAEIKRLREAARSLLVDWEDCMGAERSSIGSDAVRAALREGGTP